MMCFCSLACAAAHAIGNYDDNAMYEALQNVNAVARRAGIKIPVQPSPRRETLKCFGGQYTIEQFRAVPDANKIALVTYPPMCSVGKSIEEFHCGQLVRDNVVSPLDAPLDVGIVKSSLVKEPALKRNKPLSGEANNLQKSMGLRIVDTTSATTVATTHDPT